MVSSVCERAQSQQFHKRKYKCPEHTGKLFAIRGPGQDQPAPGTWYLTHQPRLPSSQSGRPGLQYFLLPGPGSLCCCHLYFKHCNKQTNNSPSNPKTLQAGGTNLSNRRKEWKILHRGHRVPSIL